jgi:high-affinity iron transporter
VNIASVSTTITQLRDDLEPYAIDDLKYGVFDATSILLREGLEAILIVAALLAFLQKAGNSDKRAWIWGGGLLGIIVSVLGGIAIQRFFSTVVTGTNRELIEGLTALVAAAMLFYVSFWLHRKTQLQGWQRYIQEKTTAALATGSLFSLGLLSFLAVLREGAETTLFYIGIAPSISQRDLLLGLAIGIVMLVVTGAGVLMLGRRLPLKPFFTVTSLLIFYLGFKFVGAGIHSLQVARVLPASPSVYLPSIDLIGMYPTWETTLLQVAMVVLASVVVRMLSRPSAA